jgi:Ca2+-binding RTX toxin-like protein
VDGGLGVDRLVVDYRRAIGAITGDSTSNFSEAGGGGRTVTETDGTIEHFTILTGSGADTITTGDGDDIVKTGNGASTISAGQGVNRIIGGNNSDTITALDGGNYIDAGNGANSITSGGGDDTLLSGKGADTIVAGGAPIRSRSAVVRTPWMREQGSTAW